MSIPSPEIHICVSTKIPIGELWQTIEPVLCSYGFQGARADKGAGFRSLNLQEVLQESIATQTSSQDLVWPHLEYCWFSFHVETEYGDWQWAPPHLVFSGHSYSSFEEGEEPFWEDVIQLVVDLFSVLKGEFSIAAHGFHYGLPVDQPGEIGNLVWRLEHNKVLTDIPRDSAGYFIPYFYLLNPQRYELSKAFLKDLPANVELLPHGGALVFIRYPMDYDAEREGKAEQWYTPDACPLSGYQPLTDRGRVAASKMHQRLVELLSQEIDAYNKAVQSLPDARLDYFWNLLMPRTRIEGYLRRLQHQAPELVTSEIRSRLREIDRILLACASDLVQQLKQQGENLDTFRKSRYIIEERDWCQWWWWLDEVITNPVGEAASYAKASVKLGDDKIRRQMR
jgi:hypothetical protein